MKERERVGSGAATARTERKGGRRKEKEEKETGKLGVRRKEEEKWVLGT